MSRKRITLEDILVGIAIGILLSLVGLTMAVLGFLFWYGLPPGALL